MTLAAMLIGLAGGIVAARALGVGGRGELAAVILWPSVLCSLVELGLPTAFAYLSASGAHSCRDLARCIGPTLALQSLLVWLVGIPVILVALGGYAGDARTTAIAFLLVYAPAYLAVRYLSALNQGEGRMGVFNVARLLVPSVYGAMLVAMFLLGDVSVRLCTAAYAATWVVVLIALLAMSSEEIRHYALRPRMQWKTTRQSWSVGRAAYFGSLAPVDTLQLDVLLITAVLGPEESGLYFVAISAVTVVRVWGSTFGALALPRVASARSGPEALDVTSLFVRLTLVLSGLFAAILIVFAGPLLALVYGGDFTPAKTLVRILAVGMLAASLRYVLGDGLRGMGRPAVATWAEAIGWACGAAVLLILLPLLGVSGVAVAVSASYITTLLVLLLSAQRLGARLATMFMPSRSDFSSGRAALRETSSTR